MYQNKIVVYTISLFLLASCSSKEQNSGSNQNLKKRPALSVEGYVLKPRAVENKINSVGSLLPNEEIIIKTEVSGRVVAINFEEGSTVSKGQLLVKLNADDLEAEKNRLTLELTLAESELFRREELFKIKGVSQEELDLARNKVELIKADLALNKSKIDKTNITAPFSGKIGLRSISLGAFVSPETSVAVLRDVDNLKLEFSIPEVYSRNLKENLEIHFTVAGNNIEYSGSVYAIEPGIDINTRSLKLRAKVPNKENNLLPGTFANVTLVLENINNALMAPSNVLVPEMSSQKVWRVKNNKLNAVTVEVGIRNEKEVQLASGVNENDTIILTGILQAREGLPVKVTSVIN